MTERDRERGESPEPLDEEAAWREIVAGFGERPTPPPEEPASDPGRVPPGVWHPDAVPERGPTPGRPGGDGDGAAGDDTPSGDSAGDVRTPRRSGDEDGTDDAADGGARREPALPEDPEEAVRASGVNDTGQWSGPGPRDWGPEDDDDEGHFVPPEPPPLPQTDLITRFAWLGVIGGPVLLVVCAIFGIDVTWWIATAGIGGFLGGFATLVLSMRDEDDEWTDPGSGAVV